MATTTGSLLVTGNSTFQGLIDAEIIVGTLISGTSFTGQGTASGILATTQKNASSNPLAYTGLYAIDNNDQTVGVYAYGSSHATRPSTGWLECTTPLKIKGTSTSVFAGTNEVLIATGSNVRLPFLTASRPVSTDSSNNLVSASITGTGTTVVLSAGPTLTGTTNYETLSGTTLNTATGNIGTVGATTVNTTTANVGTVNATTVNCTSVAAAAFDGQQNVNTTSSSTQKNTSTGNDAAAGFESFNNILSSVGMYMYGSNHATKPDKAELTTLQDLIITGDTITINPDLGATTIFNASGTITANSLDASKPVVTNASKVLTSAVTTGSGSVVLATSPTLVTPVIGAATGTSLQLSGLVATSALATDASKNLVSVANTGTGNNVLSAAPTLTGTINCGPIVSTGTVTGTAISTLATTSIGSSISYKRTAGVQSIASGSAQVLLFDTAYTEQTSGVGTGFTYNAGTGRFTNGSGSTRKVIISTYLPMASTIGDADFSIVTNLTTAARSTSFNFNGTLCIALNIENAGWVQIEVFQNTGAPVNTLNVATAFPWASLTLLS